MVDYERKGSSRVWRWRHAVGASSLKAGTRHVLQTLSNKMDANGRGCYPTIDELVDLTGFSRKTVIAHLGAAKEAGWLTAVKGKFYGRMHNRSMYEARFPDEEINLPELTDSLPPEVELAGVQTVEILPEDSGEITPSTVEKLHRYKDSPENSPNTSPQTSASARGITRGERRRIERAFVRWLTGWPKAGDFSLGRARQAFERLEPNQRAACVRLTPHYLRAVPPRDRIANPAEYLTARPWEHLPAAPLVAPTERVPAKPFGKVWMAYRLWLLLQPPSGRIVLTNYDQLRLSRGEISHDALMRDKQVNGGWPEVNALIAAARHKEPQSAPSAFLKLSEGFLQAERGGELFRAWERLHQRRGWPWFQWTTDYPWFPAVDLSAGDLDAAVEAAMIEFGRLVNEGLKNDAG